MVDFSSPVPQARRHPRSFRNVTYSGQKMPDVSMATGVKVCAELRLAYLIFFLPSAKAATAPTLLVAFDREKGQKCQDRLYRRPTASCTSMAP